MTYRKVGDSDLLYNFTPKKEARFFFQLFTLGRATYEECKETIQMTAAQLKWLKEKQCALPWVLDEVFAGRAETWRLFVGMAEKWSARATAA